MVTRWKTLAHILSIEVDLQDCYTRPGPVQMVQLLHWNCENLLASEIFWWQVLIPAESGKFFDAAALLGTTSHASSRLLGFLQCKNIQTSRQCRAPICNKKMNSFQVEISKSCHNKDISLGHDYLEYLVFVTSITNLWRKIHIERKKHHKLVEKNSCWTQEGFINSLNLCRKKLRSWHYFLAKEAILVIAYGLPTSS